MRFGAHLSSEERKRSSLPARGGSMKTMSGFTLSAAICSMYLPASPTVNQQFLTPFRRAFAIASFTASRFISTPMTCFALSEALRPMVPMPQ